MLFYEFTVCDEVYKLRLSTRNIVSLEKSLNCNPLMIFGADNETLPTVTVMVAILHASLQQYQHNISLQDAYDIFDKWLSDNHTLTDFINVIVEIYKVSGLIKEDSAKN